MPRNPAAYLVGRESIPFPQGDDPLSDRMIAAQRLDSRAIQGRQFSHCTFANISFKEATLTDCEFLDCAFISCYFRRTRLTNCRFVGCKFFACDFPRVSVQSCDFRYAQFSSCAITYDEMEYNLPSEPNLREELSAGLALGAEEVGWTREARSYRLAAVAAREDHLLAAVRGSSTWYREHYPPLRRFTALIHLLVSKLNRLLWGYGERSRVLLRNLVLLALVVFPAFLWLQRGDLSVAGRGAPTIADLFWLSATTIVPVGSVNSIVTATGTARAILTIEAFCGVVIAGLFVTLLFRFVVNR
jgi:hypothetical protein